MRNFNGLVLKNENLPHLACNILEKMCSLKPSNRYTVARALAHPWITGNPNDEIPLTQIDMFSQELGNF